MKRAFGILAALACIGGSVVAQESGAAKPVEPVKPVAPQVKMRIAKPAAVAKRMKSADVPLTRAIAAAEEHSKGKALAAFADVRDDALMFTVHCVVNDACKAVVIDEKGRAKSMSDVAPAVEKQVHNGTVAEVWKAMEAEKMTLAKSIEAVSEQRSGAITISATGKFHGKIAEVYFTCVRDDESTLLCEVGPSGKVRDLRGRAAQEQPGETPSEKKDAGKGDAPAEKDKPAEQPKP